MESRSSWLTREVLTISLSAFFADLGYQAVVGLFPLYITDVLRQKPFVFGIVIGLTYGIGSIVAYAGGRLGDMYSKKKVAIAGNAAIPLLSLSGLPSSPLASSALYVSGWMCRDFRSPVRRAWLAEISVKERSRVFGFLHGLDVGGGMISAIFATLLVFMKVPMGEVMLVTALPITVSTLMLLITRYDVANVQQEEETASKRKGAAAFLLAAGLFGFSYYSLGFPIITVAGATHSVGYGILTYAVFLGSSGISGYIFGYMKLGPGKALSTAGYLVAALGSFLFAFAYVAHGGIQLFYPATAILGMGAGVIETYEPVLAASFAVPTRISAGMGSLGAVRSLGLFTSNLLVGIIFTVSVFFAYIYAALTAVLASAIMMYLVFTKAA